MMNGILSLMIESGKLIIFKLNFPRTGFIIMLSAQQSGNFQFFKKRKENLDNNFCPQEKGKWDFLLSNMCPMS
jgi:hypothetical protein